MATESDGQMLTNAEVVRGQKLLAKTQKRFESRLSWAELFWEIMGPEGLLRQMFPNPERREAFKQTAEYDRILKILETLRRKRRPRGEDAKNDDSLMITVRVPSAMHKQLTSEAKHTDVSINKLCIAKLLQEVDPKVFEKPETAPETPH